MQKKLKEVNKLYLILSSIQAEMQMKIEINGKRFQLHLIPFKIKSMRIHRQEGNTSIASENELDSDAGTEHHFEIQ